MSNSNTTNEPTMNATTRYPVGTILRSTWGYNMTINSFFQVVGTTAKGIKVRAINSAKNGSQFGKERPIKDSFDPHCVITKGETRTIVLQKKGREVSPSIGKHWLSVASEDHDYSYNYMD